MPGYLHEREDFGELLQVIATERNIDPGLIEKDYWIMHVLYGMQKQGFDFELKGGTSLSKGYHVIHRFSEDIDIHIHPPKELGINENPNNHNKNNIAKRQTFYDQLAKSISIPGIIKVERDLAFDDAIAYRSGGIRLFYNNATEPATVLKEGILLEVGFDMVNPNRPVTISSWALDRASNTIGSKIIDNKAVDVLCYHPGYTLVEKLQTIAIKFRKEQESGIIEKNYMRQYYDVYCLLALPEVASFIGTEDYFKHKANRFPKQDFAIPINQNQAFLLEDKSLFQSLKSRYIKTQALYYEDQVPFENVLERIKKFANKL
ncbi:nucleotidyl transferase AbiEii/AbiGii toxin family protein [Rhizosphaericola mali]|uniref:Nucleotidyl transferase AbiEii/AbiGii toxin family protein n=1 Tax=Rhizosphaericola mali TaxID=2545455 RepID=A0A5P2G8N6_9BACT|nr:nucleotidyl transferase AbiEii/AbiGii toxin family protein [Rhizosphaericola mali]QES91048.1 nucleotidyl transferase AbiEii/AbiGii toxin family protein [Rhizosphaericola mali]